MCKGVIPQYNTIDKQQNTSKPARGHGPEKTDPQATHGQPSLANAFLPGGHTAIRRLLA